MSHTLDTVAPHAVAFQQNTRDEVRLINGDGAITGALQAESGMKQQNYIAANNFGERDISTALSSKQQRINGDTETFVVNAFNGYTGGADDNDAQAGHIISFVGKAGSRTRSMGETIDISATLDSDESANLSGSFGVRRLTPIECERLQGFPDDWTDGQADSVRYRQLGNAIAVPCAEWIGKRIVESEITP